MTILLAALFVLGCALAEGTALSTADYQEIVSTYSINEAIPDYADYIAAWEDAARPDAVVTVEADAFVRYEDEGVAAAPVILADHDGMPGNDVLTGEESLIEWTFSVPEEGLYDLSVLYYPYEGKNSAIQTKTA